MNNFNKLIPVCLFALLLIRLSIADIEPENRYNEYFDMNLVELLKVKIITASKKPEKISDIPASVVIITRKEIEAYGYESLIEILKNIPGLYPINDYNMGYSFGIRGFWSGLDNDDIVFLVNGVDYEFAYTSGNPITQYDIPVEAIDKIEIIRGPMSVVYGQGAVFGVINVTTNEILEEDANQLSFSVTDDMSIRSSYYTSGSKDNIKYRINASKSISNGMDIDYKKLTTLPGYEGSTKNKLDFTGKYFNSNLTINDISFSLSYHESRSKTYFTFPTESNTIDFESVIFDLKYTKKLNTKFEVSARSSYNLQNRFYNNLFLYKEFYGKQFHRVKSLENEVNLIHHLSEKINISYNLYYKTIWDILNNYDMPSFGVPGLENNNLTLKDGDRIDNLAIYSQIEYNATEKLRFILGARYEYLLPYGFISQHVEGAGINVVHKADYDVVNKNFIPRAAAIYHINKNNSFKLMYGRAINQPSFFQNSKNTLDPNAGDLFAEKIDTYELNYIGIIHPKLSINSSLFYNKLTNLITRIINFDEAGNYTTWNENEGKITTRGFELTLDAQLIKDFKIEISSIYQITEDMTQGKEDVDPAYSPQLLGYLKLYYKMNNLSVGLIGNYVSEMKPYWDDRPVANDPTIVIGRIGQTTPAYTKIDLNFRYTDLMIDDLFLGIKISNITNTEIRYPTFNNNAWMNRGTLGEPRSIILSIGYKF